MTNIFASFEVVDRATFIGFLELLQKDLVENPDSWENKNLGDFLEAMCRYASAIQGFYDNTEQNVNADKPSWKVFADLLQGAKIYE